VKTENFICSIARTSFSQRAAPTSPPAASVHSESKMKMQCVIAAISADDPCSSLAYIWQYPTFNQLLRRDSFDHLIDFFDTVPRLLTDAGFV
jgi:hypothetical protein